MFINFRQGVYKFPTGRLENTPSHPEGGLEKIIRLHNGHCARCPNWKIWNTSLKKCETPCMAGYRRNVNWKCVQAEYSYWRCLGGQYDLKESSICTDSYVRTQTQFKYDYSQIEDYQCSYIGYQKSSDACRSLVIGTMQTTLHFSAPFWTLSEWEKFILSRCLGGSGQWCTTQDKKDGRRKRLDLYNPKTNMIWVLNFWTLNNSPMDYYHGESVPTYPHMRVQEACQWSTWVRGKECSEIKTESHCRSVIKWLWNTQYACRWDSSSRELISCLDEWKNNLPLNECSF